MTLSWVLGAWHGPVAALIPLSQTSWDLGTPPLFGKMCLNLANRLRTALGGDAHKRGCTKKRMHIKNQPHLQKLSQPQLIFSLQNILTAPKNSILPMDFKSLPSPFHLLGWWLFSFFSPAPCRHVYLGKGELLKLQSS